MAQQASPGVSAWRIGGLFGLVSGALALGNTILGISNTLDPVTVIRVSYGLFVVGLVLDLLSGLFTAQRGATVSLGALAGLVAGGLSALLWMLVNVALSLAFPEVTTQHFNVGLGIGAEPVGPGALPVIFAIAGAVAIIVGIALGAGSGARRTHRPCHAQQGCSLSRHPCLPNMRDQMSRDRSVLLGHAVP
jgi:hypothetical protein